MFKTDILNTNIIQSALNITTLHDIPIPITVLFGV